MNEVLFETITTQHPVLTLWRTAQLTPEIYPLSDQISLVAHVPLSQANDECQGHCGTVLDVKYRQGKTQTMYRLQVESDAFVIKVYDSESFETQTQSLEGVHSIWDAFKIILTERLH